MTGRPDELIYPYIKLREEFGRQPRFLEDHTRQNMNIKPNKGQRKKFRRQRLVDKSIQAVTQFAEDYMNTERVVHADIGILHEEGGWPKDVSLAEPEMIIRHRKKLEKDEQFAISLPIMTKLMEKFVKQNNALELFEEHCPRKWQHKDKQMKSCSAQTIQIFRDFSFMKRSVHKIDWAPDNVGRMAVCHVPRRFDRTLRESSTDAFIWDIEIPSRPECMIRSGSHITDIHYHQKDLHTLVGACFDGTVECWDNRVGPNPQMVSPLDISHTDICSSALWINSKTNTEFFSAGMDGQVIWWDIRNLGETLENLWVDPEKGQSRPELSLPATVLEYEHTLPTKLMVGAETGNVLIFMKKGKTPADRLVNNYKAHRGPVVGLQRNPTFIKNFLTVGDSTCRIFAEDCRDSSIMWTKPNDAPFTHGAWIPSRPSCFGVSRADGHIDIWDLLRDCARPHFTVKVADVVLTYFAPCGPPSKFLALGTSKGAVYLQRLSESLYKSEKFDKPILAAAFERESRREKMMEHRHREIRLRKRDKEKAVTLQESINKDREAFREQAEAQSKETGVKVEVPDYSENTKYDIAYEARNEPRTVAERKFFEDLDTELREKGIDAWEEYKVHEEETTADEHGGDDGEALEITAADLAAMQPVEGEAGETEAPNLDVSRKESAAPPKAAETLPPQPAPKMEAPPPPPQEQEEEEQEEEEGRPEGEEEFEEEQGGTQDELEEPGEDEREEPGEDEREEPGDDEREEPGDDEREEPDEDEREEPGEDEE